MPTRYLKILILIGGLGLSLFLIFQPKYIVDDPNNSVTDTTDNETIENTNQMPDTSVLKPLRNLFNNAVDLEKKLIFADSLAEIFNDFQLFDSASYYIQLVEEADVDKKINVKIADSYFSLFLQSVKGPSLEVPFNFRSNGGKFFSGKVEQRYQNVLKNDSSNVTVKIRLLLASLTSGNPPMQTILSLREIADNHPENEEASYIMGQLSIFISKYDKAIERFEHTLELNPKNIDAAIYLAFCYRKIGNDAEADKLINRALSETKNEELRKVLENI